ncbi:hypothetical protein M3667_14200 [Microbacterium sp. P26]|uniref:hypothetical protein n=1 Tax=Microbacterium TaxID=33882 RepID=UPI00203C9058|nr:hypothetical protein [Microbacterium sp. P26]MCM3503020.1 hypothetical protein [Microbacterium sp. P26]
MTTTPRYADPSEFGGGRNQYRTPDGVERDLDVSERARLLRRSGIRDAIEPSPGEPFEMGERVG